MPEIRQSPNVVVDAIVSSVPVVSGDAAGRARTRAKSAIIAAPALFDGLGEFAAVSALEPVPFRRGPALEFKLGEPRFPA